VVYSVLEALEIARKEPAKEIVFLGLGFETTSPTVAWALREARNSGLGNFSVLSAHKALLPAMEALLRDPEVAIDGFLCPGHATMVLGAKAYRGLVEEYGVPCVVAGFEPNDVLAGLVRLLGLVASGRASVENAYPRAVDEEGNPAALAALEETFVLEDSEWRGLGNLPGSGYFLAARYAAHDARRRFLDGLEFSVEEPAECRCAEVLRGVATPSDCPLFGRRCSPENPVGACMVSSEGSCGAHYRYRSL
jgi:hydrogenase expression/formation protein HypD